MSAREQVVVRWETSLASMPFDSDIMLLLVVLVVLLSSPGESFLADYRK